MLLYRPKCRKKTEDKNSEDAKTKKVKPML